MDINKPLIKFCLRGFGSWLKADLVPYPNYKNLPDWLDISIDSNRQQIIFKANPTF